MGLIDILFQSKIKNKVVIIGLDSAGKTTLVSFLQTGKFIQHTPTLGKKKVDIEVKNTRISLFDMGGQSDFRSLWMGEVNSCKCVVFVLDKSNPGRFGEAKEELVKMNKVLNDNNIPLVVLANKHDLAPDITTNDIILSLSLGLFNNFRIFNTSSKTGYGIIDAFLCIESFLTGKEYFKQRMAKAISIFDKGGSPIVIQTDELSKQELFKGCMYAAITEMFKTLNGGTPLNMMGNCESGEIVLIHKTENFIGTLVWTKDLDVDMKTARDALESLMEHIEGLGHNKDLEDVKMHIVQYSSNLM